MSGEHHIALPLKYRPMTFSDVIGQEHVVRTLRNAISSNRVANAYLFIGPRGIGKTSMSRIFAKALNCLNPEGVEPCGKCDNCKAIAESSSIDVIELDAASHNKVEDVKPIIEAVEFRPVASKYKIFIIDECHMLTTAAWNALLKTLEEPPPYVKFIFATTEGDKVLATIISRCQRFDLRRILTNDIVRRLEYVCAAEHISAERDALLAIARGAEGGMRDALSSLDQLISFKGDTIKEEDALGVFGLVSRSSLEKLAAAIISGDVAGILSLIEGFDSAGKNMRSIAKELLAHFRNIAVYQALQDKSASLQVTAEQLATLKEQSAKIDASRIFKICDQLADLDDKLRMALGVRTLIEISLIRASRIASVATVEELMRAVKALQSQVAGGGSVAAVPATEAQSAIVAPAAVPPSKPAAAETRYAEHKLPDVMALLKNSGTNAAKPKPASVQPAAKPPPVAAPVAEPPKEPEKEATPFVPGNAEDQDIMNDRKLNDVLAALPGAFVTDIRR